MKLLIVDDHPMVRKGLLSTLSFEKTIKEITEASNIEEALNFITKDRPDIAIIDLNLGREDGLDIVEKIKSKNILTKCIILTSSIQKDDFIRAQKLEVDGYLLKEAFAEDIIYVCNVVARGKKFIDPEILELKKDEPNHNELNELTQREKDVLKELRNGLSNVQIAKRLFISEHTVKKHVSNILMKLGLTHRTQAALVAKDVVNL